MLGVVTISLILMSVSLLIGEACTVAYVHHVYDNLGDYMIKGYRILLDGKEVSSIEEKKTRLRCVNRQDKVIMFRRR